MQHAVYKNAAEMSRDLIRNSLHSLDYEVTEVEGGLKPVFILPTEKSRLEVERMGFATRLFADD